MFPVEKEFPKTSATNVASRVHVLVYERDGDIYLVDTSLCGTTINMGGRVYEFMGDRSGKELRLEGEAELEIPGFSHKVRIRKLS